MESVRLPRFSRAFSEISSIQLTARDMEIIKFVHRHRFLRSPQILALLGDSSQQVLRRLQLLYHHGYLERPRAQIDYYHQGGSRPMVYGLGHKGAGLLKRELNLAFHELDWGEKNRNLGKFFLEHALLVSDVMVAMELACRKHGQIRLITREELSFPESISKRRHLFQWSVDVSSRLKIGLIPDAVFALEFSDKPAGSNRIHFFLEADRGTMPVMRQNLSQSSFYRKLLAYEATWAQSLHRSRFGFHRFRVLTVTSSAARVDSLAEACSQLERGRGIFLFSDLASLNQQGPLNLNWKTALPGGLASLLD